MSNDFKPSRSSKVFIAGAAGMVGSSILRRLTADGYENILTPKSTTLDLIVQKEVEEYFDRQKPEAVIIAAAKVGGIGANSSLRAQFIYENLMIEANTIHAAYRHGVRKLISLGSSCIYPRMALQPMKEEELLSGPLETTNEPYAVAKIAGIKLCESYYRQYGCNFFSVMPTNLFGPNDNFDLESSHVIPALIRKFHEAKIKGADSVLLWGSGKPRREFMYVDDLARGVCFLMENHDANDLFEKGISHINIGTGEDLKIGELASKIAKLVGFTGKVAYDSAKPDGTPRKLLDVSRMKALGWAPLTSLDEGLQKTYDWFLGATTARGV
ncbi:MAG: GDP-L-fucose synthase [Acidobacteriota bacterium]